MPSKNITLTVCTQGHLTKKHPNLARLSGRFKAQFTAGRLLMEEKMKQKIECKQQRNFRQLYTNKYR